MMQNRFKKLLDKYSAQNVLLFLCLLFLPTQLGRHFFFDFSYIFSLRIDYLAAILYFWDILLVVLVIKWFLGKPGINRLAFFGLFFFLLSQGVSIFFSKNIGAGLVKLEQLTIVCAFALYLASQRIENIKQIIITSLLAGLIFESVLAILQFTLGSSVGFWILGERTFSLATPLIATFNWYGEVFLRPYATFPHPNVLSAFLVICLPLILGMPLREKYLNKNYLKLVGMTLGLGFLATLLTFSRAALIVLAVESVIFFKKKARLLLFLTLFTLPFIFVRFDSAFNFDYLSISRREELAMVAKDQFISKPVFGVGLNNFISNTAESSLISGQNRFLQPVHNIFLLTLAETGFLGLLGLVVLLGLPVVRLWRKKSPLSKLFLGLWGAIFFLGLFDHYFLTIAQGQRLLFLIWGLSMQENKS